MTGTTQAPDKLRRLDARTILLRLRLSGEHERAIEHHATSASLLAHLVEHGLLWEAARLLGYALPEREAVWWACMCVSHTAPRPIPVAQEQALLVAEAWVREPNDTARRRTAPAAAAAGYDSAAAWCARAAHASRPDLPLHTGSGRRIERAIVRAVASDGVGREAQRLHRFIMSGRAIAAGGAGRLPPENETGIGEPQ